MCKYIRKLDQYYDVKIFCRHIAVVFIPPMITENFLVFTSQVAAALMLDHAVIFMYSDPVVHSN